MIATLLLASVPAALGGGVEDSGADSVLASYDLSGVLAGFDDAQIQESLLLSAGSQHPEHLRTAVDDMYSRPDADALVEILARLFQEEFEYEGRDLTLQGERELLVLAPADVQTRVQLALAELERTMTSAVELQIDVLSVPAEAPAPFGGRCVVEESELADLATAGRVLEQYRVRLSAGRTSVVERMRELPLVVDYNVEIAQGSVVHDPVVGRAEAGTRILLRGAPLSEGIALSVFFAHGEPGQEEPTPIEAPLRSILSSDKGAAERYVEAPRLQERYEIAFRSAAFDTVLLPGKALVLGSEMQLVTAISEPGGTRDREIVVIRRVGGGMPRLGRFVPPVGRRELLLVNAESLSAPWAQTWGALRGDAALAEVPLLHATFRAEPSVFLVDWIDSRFSTWRLVGPWLVCVSDQTWDGDAAARLDALLAGSVGAGRLLEVELVGNVRGQPVASWRLPVRAGSDFAALVGLSTTSLVAYDVEVAQFAAGADPLMAPQFIGLTLRGHVMELASGGAALDLDAELRHRRALPRLASLGGPLMTKLEKTPFDRLRLEGRVVVEPEAALAGHVLGDRAGTATVAVSLR